MNLAEINAMDEGAFVASLGGAYEHSPWVAKGAWAKAPFSTPEDLHDAFMSVIHAATPEAQLALIRAHPDLAGKAAIARELTAESTFEQASAGLDRLTTEEFAKFHSLNTAYRERFGIPFIICVRLNTKDSILFEFERRLARDADTERMEALKQIGEISRLRLKDLEIA